MQLFVICKSGAIELCKNGKIFNVLCCVRAEVKCLKINREVFSFVLIVNRHFSGLRIFKDQSVIFKQFLLNWQQSCFIKRNNMFL